MEKEMASRSSILAWEIPQRSLVVKGHKKSQTRLTRLTKQQRETETGSRRGPRAMYAGTPRSQEAPLSGICIGLMAEGPYRATGGGLLLSSEVYLASQQ